MTIEATDARAAEPIDFSRDVLPILSDNCFKCHGPDEEARKAELRLDTREGLFRIKEGVAVTVPGRSAESELIARTGSNDPEEMMPPPKSNRKLTDVQKTLIKRWVDEGAEWRQHWAFAKMRKTEPPSKARNPVDAFVIDALEKRGLRPAPEARKERLIRRVTLDLTGLPPTPEEIDSFLHDTTTAAYEKVVDRLLASPRFGERMASEWLDVARYGDTHGYQMDRFRAMWPYRDWVIKAFNENLPYDQFAIWQLAGDLLPNATKEQRLATAFNRLHMQNEEGGIVEEEFRVAYVVDRVTTFGTAFLGLTLECARCHDHKFDPISQREFYSLFAFFQNIDESGQTSFFTDAMPVPTLLLTNRNQDEEFAQVRVAIATKEQELEALRASEGEAFAEWLNLKPAEPSVPGCIASFDFEALVNNQLVNAVDAAKPGRSHENPQLVPGKMGQAAELDGENGFTFPGVGNFSRTDPFSLGIWLQPEILPPRAVVLHHSKAPIDAGSRGYELLLEEGHVAFGLHHMWPGNSLKVRTEQALRTGAWTHVAVTYDGSSRANGLRIYLDGHAAPLEVVRDGLHKDITYGGGEPELAIGYRFRDNGFRQGRADEFRLFDRALSAIEVAHLAGGDDLRAAWRNNSPALREYFFNTVYGPAQQARNELKALRIRQNKLLNPISEIMVMQELTEPKPAFVLKRGAYDMRGDAITATTPRVLPPFPANVPRNRLGLARWLVDPQHPLTARVAVNRFWQMMFGRGLVETSDNFGAQGASPTHPELLDWLAMNFIANGWNVKGLLRTIALSATYRQDSRGTPALFAEDPENKFLARGPSRRLTAEMIRDQALAVSDLLAEKLGGPSVKPYQPKGLWEIAMGKPEYQQGKGDDLHRRSLYTFWKRTVPPPAMMTFDAADRSYCTVRRQSTSTPLQALALLNDTQIVEAARGIAQRMLREGGPALEQQIGWAFRLVTSRFPTDKESAILRQLFTEQRDLFAHEEAAARKLLAVGETKNDSTLNSAGLAAGTVLAEAILNHDEAIMRR